MVKPSWCSSGVPVRRGDVVGGSYQIQRILGYGGMSVVYRALDLNLCRPVAIKFLNPALKHVADCFRREAQALARLASEHIVRVFDFGEYAGELPYMVLELVDGRDLRRHCDGRTLPVGEAVRVVRQTLEGLAFAHDAGLVHRDVKPENIGITTRPDGGLLVKLLDFGVATGTHEPSAAGDSPSVGTPLYMAPEQMEHADRADPRSDIWAIGVMLYELLSGQRPFEGESVDAIRRAIANGPEPLATLAPDVPLALAEIVMQCLAQNPDDRWPTARALAVALDAFVPVERHTAPLPPRPPAPRRAAALSSGFQRSFFAGGRRALRSPPLRSPPLRGVARVMSGIAIGLAIASLSALGSTRLALGSVTVRAPEGASTSRLADRMLEPGKVGPRLERETVPVRALPDAPASVSRRQPR